jgi:hypothetical protein
MKQDTMYIHIRQRSKEFTHTNELGFRKRTEFDFIGQSTKLELDENCKSNIIGSYNLHSPGRCVVTKIRCIGTLTVTIAAKRDLHGSAT